MSTKTRLWPVYVLLLLVAFGFRLFIALRLANDTPVEGIIDAQMARNVLEQHVYSHDTQPPYNPSLVRLPGYPLFLAGLYSIFGHTNNGAVRIVQALIDTATCALVALLAFYWQPDEKKKRLSAIAALALAAICPFTTIYAATILTEVPTNFLVAAMLVAVTLAFRNQSATEDTEGEQTNKKIVARMFLWWSIAGLLGGLAVLMRPDNGLFLAAVGITLVVTGLWRTRSGDPKRRRRFALPARSKIFRTLVTGALFSIAFALV